MAAAEHLNSVTRRAQEGDAGAQYLLGALLFSGQHGLPKNHNQAAAWFRAAAEAGHAKAQLSLGNLYFNGSGVPQSYSGAAEWYNKAAEQGNELAQFGLGLIYANGLGTSKDDALAYMWFKISAVRGETKEKADIALGKLARNMTREQICEAEKLTVKWIAARPAP